MIFVSLKEILQSCKVWKVTLGPRSPRKCHNYCLFLQNNWKKSTLSQFSRDLFSAKEKISSSHFHWAPQSLTLDKKPQLLWIYQPKQFLIPKKHPHSAPENITIPIIFSLMQHPKNGMLNCTIFTFHVIICAQDINLAQF